MCAQRTGRSETHSTLIQAGLGGVHAPIYPNPGEPKVITTPKHERIESVGRAGGLSPPKSRKICIYGQTIRIGRLAHYLQITLQRPDIDVNPATGTLAALIDFQTRGEQILELRASPKTSINYFISVWY
jgi:hypothetical protein